jgi:hypothetical protein
MILARAENRENMFISETLGLLRKTLLALLRYSSPPIAWFPV